MDIEVGKEDLEELDLPMEVLFLDLNGMAADVEEDRREPCQVDASYAQKVECHFLVVEDTDFVVDAVSTSEDLDDWLACCLKRDQLQRHFH